MKILITGISGMLGTPLSIELQKLGYDLIGITRNIKKAQNTVPGPIKFIQPDKENFVSIDVLKEVDGVIHLAGENIAAKRWSKSYKKTLKLSRVALTADLIKQVNLCSNIKFFVGASALGFYGDRADVVMDEGQDRGNGFLSDLCVEWEDEYKKLRKDIRTVIFRISTVLDDSGGMLNKIIPQYQNGLGGVLGSGKQWFSWIHIKDMIKLLVDAVQNSQRKGIYNACAPSPVTNSDFNKTLAHSLNVKAFLKAPETMLKTILGEFSTLLLSSTRMIPNRLEAEGFSFNFPDLKIALEDIVLDLRSHAKRFRAYQWVEQPLDQSFEFFSNPYNLEKITPPWLNFKVISISTAKVEQDSLITYRLKLRGVPLKWLTKILKWQPKEQFIDTQLKGPYKKWHHTHRFCELKGGTLLEDEVIYSLPMGFIGKFVGGAYVASDVKKIFAYRQKSIAEIFLNTERKADTR